MNRTSVNIGHNYSGSFVCKESGRFGANALPGACDDGDLPGEEAVGVVEVAGDLGDALCHCESYNIYNGEAADIWRELWNVKRKRCLHSDGD